MGDELRRVRTRGEKKWRKAPITVSITAFIVPKYTIQKIKVNKEK